MVKCRVEKVLQYNQYELKFGDKKQILTIELYNFDKLNVGENIFIANNLLDKNNRDFCSLYAFEPSKIDLNEVKWLPETDFLVVERQRKKYLLKRIYG